MPQRRYRHEEIIGKLRTFFAQLKRLRLEQWNDCSDNEAAFNVYCSPRR